MKTLAIGLVAFLLFASLAAGSPEVGSDAWCDNMKAKSKADWTANEAKEYAKSRIFKSDD